MRNFIISLIILFSVFPSLSYSQDSLLQTLQYEVQISYPALAISKETVDKAETLKDLYEQYKPSWVREYISVELTSYRE
ncbi:MAG: hypothetical protein R3250_09925, partial [Melioribacteraceae bacterium]|nr:hypothetical protein [Melioribacteraceae bacterium]